jgi:hypothetical protein
MRGLLITGMFLLFAGTIAMVHADGVPLGEAEADVPDCITYRGEARYGALGYNHIVIITNGCPSDARCTVSTNASPDTQNVRVPKGETKEVTTLLGSPAREFTPHVTCTLK